MPIMLKDFKISLEALLLWEYSDSLNSFLNFSLLFLDQKTANLVSLTEQSLDILPSLLDGL